MGLSLVGKQTNGLYLFFNIKTTRSRVFAELLIAYHSNFGGQTQRRAVVLGLKTPSNKLVTGEDLAILLGFILLISNIVISGERGAI